MRIFHLAPFAFLLLTLSACSKTRREDTSPGSSAAVQSSEPAVTVAPPPSAAPSDSARAEGPSPFGASSAAAPPEPTPAEASSATRRPIGGFKDWLAAYSGFSAPDKNPPPQLGTLADVPNAPQGLIAFRKSGQIVTVHLPDGKETQLTRAGTQASPVWSPDGRQIAFFSNREGGRYRVFIMTADGKDQRAVSRGLVGNDPTEFSLVFSPDGRKLLYSTPTDTSLGGVDTLILCDIATGAEEELARVNLVPVLDDPPAFDLAGKRVVYVSDDQIHLLDIATKKVQVLPTAGLLDYVTPHFLSDNELVFAGSEGMDMMSRDMRLFRMTAKGEGRALVSNAFHTYGWAHVVLSPDRSKVAVQKNARQGGFGAEFHLEITVVSLDGRRWVDLTSAFPRPFYSTYYPTWAPDNRHLAFALHVCPYAGCDPEIRSVVIADTNAAAPKLAFVGDGTAPAWQPRR